MSESLDAENWRYAQAYQPIRHIVKKSSCGYKVKMKRRNHFVAVVAGCILVSSCGLSQAQREARTQAEQDRLDSLVRVREMEAREAEEARRRAEEQAKEDAIVGTYIFEIHKPNMDKIATSYSYGSGFTYQTTQVGTMDGEEYLVVHPDMRVSLLHPGGRKTYIGDVKGIVDGAFLIRCATSDSEIGNGYILYKNGKSIGTSAGYRYPGEIVVDTNTKRVYKSVSDWKGRDIGDTEHLMYRSKEKQVRSSNDTRIEYNYFDQYKSKYQNR